MAARDAEEGQPLKPPSGAEAPAIEKALGASQSAESLLARERRGSDATEDETSCATRGPLRGCCVAPCLLLCICGFVLVQSMVVTGLASACLTSIGRRYDISSTVLGALVSVYDLVVLLAAVFVGHFGGRGSVPRWLGSGMATLSVGALVYALPHFVDAAYEVDTLAPTDTCRLSGSFSPDCGGEESALVAVFFVAQLLIALGASGVYVLSPPYLDQVVEKPRLPVYLGVFYATGALGPAFGFLIAGWFLAMWVDPGRRPQGVEPTDPQWVGAWWLGYVVCGALGLVLSVPLCLFPRFLPRTAHIREENRKHSLALARARRDSRAAAAPAAAAAAAASASASAAASSSPHPQPPAAEAERPPTLGASVARCLSNRTFLFNCLGTATEGFAVTGFASFLPKAGESIFGLSASASSFAMGLVIIPGAAGGVFAGGLLLRRLRPNTERTARLCWMIALTAALVMFGFLIGCDSVQLAGVNRPYASQPAPAGLASTCNAACTAPALCDPDTYDPVCGDDGVTYFSPCHAGCRVRLGARTDPEALYANCTCVSSALVSADPAQGVGALVKRGRCASGCNSLLPFLGFLFVAMFLTFLNNVPATAVILRCVEVQHRSVAMGIQNVIFRLLGTIPAPIVFGALIDRLCFFHATRCGARLDTCWEYDARDLSKRFLLLALLPKGASAAAFFASWYNFRPPPGFEQDEAAAAAAAEADAEADAALQPEAIELAAVGDAATEAPPAAAAPSALTAFTAVAASELVAEGEEAAAMGEERRAAHRRSSSDTNKLELRWARRRNSSDQ